MNNLIRCAAAIAWVTTCCYAQSASRYTITTVAGNGTSGFSGDGGGATSAQLASPSGLAIDGSRAIYIADQFNHRLRKIPDGGTISTIAGKDTSGYAGDAAQATSASLLRPTGVAVDSSGNVYFADAGNHVVRKVAPGGIITTVAGNNGKGPGYSGDGGPATDAQLNTPLGVALDSSGNLYITEIAGHRLRRLSPDGTIRTVAGTGTAGFGGDGGGSSGASLNMPFGVAVDAGGNIYIGDSGNHRVRRIAADGIITTVAGTGTRGYSGDLGAATSARLNYPSGVAVDAAGNLYIVDNANSRVRKVSPNGTITTIAGNGRFAYTGDGGLATSASLYFPTGIALDSAANIYITDNQSNVIRKLSPAPESDSPPAIGGVISAGSFGASRSVAPGSWIEIYGSSLAVSSRSWSGSDFGNQMAPTVLDGTSVTIGGQPAFVSYVSGGQVNALVPSGVEAGEQQIVVSAITGTSAPYAVTVDATKPGLFAPPALRIGARQYAGGLFGGSSVYALPAGAVAGTQSRPAAPGETITLYGVGFGGVSPNILTGRIAQGTSAITGSLEVFFGETKAALSYAGLAPGSVGLYQFNVTVPAGVAGEAVPLTYTFNGVKGEQTLYTAVQ